MKCKEIQQIHNSVVIKTWSSVKEAGRVGNYNTSLIREVCIGKRKSHAGYEWKYVNISDKEANMGVKKPISCQFRDGAILIFASKKEASEYLEDTESSIHNILLGRKKQNMNYKLSYLDE